MLNENKRSLLNGERDIHVAIVSNGNVINHKGGEEKVFCDLANALSRGGYQVTAICCDVNQGEPGFEISSKVNFINASDGSLPIYLKGVFREFFCFSLDKKERHLNRILMKCNWQAKEIKKYSEIINSVDVCISFRPETTFILKKIIKAKVPIITMLHMVPSYFSKQDGFVLYKKAVDETAFLAVLMPSYVEMARHIFKKVPIVTISNAVPQFATSAKLIKKKIICVARLNKQKRVDLLLKAFHLTRQDFPEWVVEFWGETDIDAKYKKKMYSLRHELNLDDSFLFCGTTVDIESVLSNASIFVLPSAYEGFSLALTEAMSKGLPVVGCIDCPGTNELISDGKNGFLVAPNCNDLAKALKTLMKNVDLRLKFGRKAREDMKNFSPDKIWKQWDRLIVRAIVENR